MDLLNFDAAEAATEAGPSGAIPERQDLPVDCTWDVEALYADAAAWEADLARLPDLVTRLEAFQGTLSEPVAVLRFLRLDSDLDVLLDRLYCYAHLKADEDTSHAANQARESRMRSTLSETAARLAWVRPELLANPEEALRTWLDLPELAAFRYPLLKLLRQKPHTLSTAEERILSGAGTLFAAPGDVYKLLTNADLKFPDVADADGNPRPLSQGRYISFMLNRDRGVRQRAFSALYDAYAGVHHTTAATLRHHVHMHNFLARTRHYPSALEAALSSDHVPVALYEALIAAVHDALPHFHRYTELRRRCLGIETLDMMDMYVPIVPAADVKVPFDTAMAWVLEACAPLGDDYVQALRQAIPERWIDRCENRGKRSGAYSSGCYGSRPYILLNYQDTLDDAFTLAHELGHSLHTRLANAAQPPQTAGYPIFIAEIASTANEALLLHYLLGRNDTTPEMRAYLLNHACDTFRGTVYRQTMFAEFEKRLHEQDAAGTALTPDSLASDYADLNRRYHGPAVTPDPRIALEWSRIPHFYYNFYVYKYATSYCASQILVRRLLDDTQARQAYLGLLQAGGSADPLDLVRQAGADLSSPATLSAAFTTFAETLGELAA
ncbi:MAG: oligoendopeptidase F, partial [Lentisphaerae bacterium]|nr:oligoendopeptidase F [Lentisphaerota bacterium]